MTTLALAGAGLLMGLAATPHCAAMCGTPCGLIVRGCGGSRPARALLAWQLGRATSYAAAGAVAAASVGLIAAVATQAAVLRPVWGMLQAALLVFGLQVAATGRLPAVLDGVLQRVGRRLGRRLGAGVAGAAGAAGSMGGGGGGRAALDRVGLAPIVLRRPTPSRSGRAFMFGGLWAAWPCGVLHAVLVVAALAEGPAEGAAVMLAFAAGSGLGPAAVPWLGSRLGRPTRPLALRLAGLVVALAAALSLAGLLGLGVGAGFVDWCRAL